MNCLSLATLATAAATMHICMVDSLEPESTLISPFPFWLHLRRLGCLVGSRYVSWFVYSVMIGPCMPWVCLSRRRRVIVRNPILLARVWSGRWTIFYFDMSATWRNWLDVEIRLITAEDQFCCQCNSDNEGKRRFALENFYYDIEVFNDRKGLYTCVLDDHGFIKWFCSVLFLRRNLLNRMKLEPDLISIDFATPLHVPRGFTTVVVHILVAVCHDIKGDDSSGLVERFQGLPIKQLPRMLSILNGQVSVLYNLPISFYRR